MGFSTQETGNKSNFSASAVFRGLIVATLASFIFSFVLGAVLNITSLSESLTPLLTLSLLGLSNFFGGWSSARVAGSGGLLHGAVTGVLFLLVTMLIFSVLLTGNLTTVTLVKKALVTIISASAGGILGVATDR